MISHATRRFWSLYHALPAEIRLRADEAYEQFQQNPTHSGLHFKEVNHKRNIWSVRINDDYRVVGVRNGGEMVWFWIGTHSEYDRLLNQLRKGA